MLAELLPGVRHARTTVVIGYLWIVALWMVTWRFLPTGQQASGILASFYDIMDGLGAATSLIVATVVAYILGSIVLLPEPHISFIPRDGDLLEDHISSLLKRAENAGLTPSEIVGAIQLDRQLTRTAPDNRGGFAKWATGWVNNRNRVAWLITTRFQLVGLKFREHYLEIAELLSADPTAMSPADKYRLHYAIGRAARDRLGMDADITVLSLMANQRDLYDHYDKIRTDKQLKKNMTPAFLAILIISLFGLAESKLDSDQITAVSNQVFYGVTFALAAFTCLRNFHTADRHNDNTVIAQAIVTGKVSSPVIQRIEALISSRSRAVPVENSSRESRQLPTQPEPPVRATSA